MALTLTTAARNAAADAVVDLCDSGASAGNLKLYHSDGTTVLSTHALNDPAFGAAATGTATANAIGSATASGTGTATTFKLFDSDSTEVLSGTVTGTGGGGDITLDSTSITSGQTVNITSLTYTQPAS